MNTMNKVLNMILVVCFAGIFGWAYTLNTEVTTLQEEYNNKIAELDSINLKRDTLNSTLFNNDQFLWKNVLKLADSTNVNLIQKTQ